MLGSISIVLTILIAGMSFTNDIITWGEQKKYKDKVVYANQSKYQKIVLTEWKDEHWLYLNGNLQFCSIDEEMYHEPLVHPIMKAHPNPQKILITNDQVPLDGIKQFYIPVGEDRNKIYVLKDLYKALTLGQTIIYVNTVRRVEKLSQMLEEENFPVILPSLVENS